MKKILAFILSLILLFSMNTIKTYAIDPDNPILNPPVYDYEYATTNSDYNRIYKDSQGLWYGVIEITDSMVTVWNCSYNKCTNNAIYLSFSRDLEELVSIKFDYTLKTYCDGFPLLGLCIGTKIESEEGSEEVFNKYTDGSFMEFITNNDGIVNIDYTDYDYRIITEESNEIYTVEIIKFTYILTEAEIIDLRLDIQEQYDEELAIIVDNDILTPDEVTEQIEILEDEYSEYEIDFGEEMTSECVGDGCFVESVTDESSWLDGFWEKLFEVLIQVAIVAGGFIASGTIIIMIGYLLLNKAVKLSGQATIGSLKMMKDSGVYWGETTAKGIGYFFSTVFKGITSIFTRK